MVLYCYCDEEPDTYITIKHVYNYDSNLRQNKNIFFDFHIDYTRAPEVDSDGELEDFSNLDTLRVLQTKVFDKEWLLSGGKDQTQAIVYHILDLIEAPCYSAIVDTLTETILELKERDAISASPKVERIEIMMDVLAWRFPGESDDDVQLAVAPANDEAVDDHLETVVVDKEEHCAICLDKIRVGSDMAAGRMPCMHVFHRTCPERWLRNSGVCPVCRAVFPL